MVASSKAHPHNQRLGSLAIFVAIVAYSCAGTASRGGSHAQNKFEGISASVVEIVGPKWENDQIVYEKPSVEKASVPHSQ